MKTSIEKALAAKKILDSAPIPETDFVHIDGYAWNLRTEEGRAALRKWLGDNGYDWESL